jgi:hypothetical protein
MPERRLGRFKIADAVRRMYPEIFRQVMDKVVVVDEQPSLIDVETVYTAYGLGFDLLGEGEEPPWYTISTAFLDNKFQTVVFNRVKEDECPPNLEF